MRCVMMHSSYTHRLDVGHGKKKRYGVVGLQKICTLDFRDAKTGR